MRIRCWRCRRAFVVNSVDEAREVLKVLLKDARVHLIKNRFDTCSDANSTAGYRDMNLQLSFAKLDGTDFEGFIFELQIHVEAILKLKNAEGHKRYIVLRNLRGA